MASQYDIPAGFEGGVSNMVPASFISRQAEDGNLQFGQPVKQGTDDRQAKGGMTTTDFVGITVAEDGIPYFEEGKEARIMTEGAIWVRAAGTVKAGDKPTYDSGWKTAGTNKPELQDARYETGGGNGDLVQIRMWGVGVAST